MVDAANTTHLYQNLQLYNAASATAAIDAKFNTEFNEAFLRKAGDFDGSIVRLSLPMSALPYFNVTPRPAHAPGGQTTLKVTLSWRGVDYLTYVTLLDVSGGTAVQSVYFINQFVDSVNVALAASYTAVTAANPTDYNLFPGHQPYIQYDKVTQLFSMITDVNSWENSAAIGSPAIWFNWPLQQLFANLPYIFASYNSASGKDCQARIVNRGFNLLNPTIFEVPFCILNQAFVTGTNYTSITVKALASGTPTYGLPAGTFVEWRGSQLIINSSNNAVQFVPGMSWQLSAPAAAGATSLSVNPLTCTQGLAAGNFAGCYINPQQIYTTDDTPSVVNWFAFGRIVVTTNRMPIRSEMAPSVSQLGQFSTQNILTDFVVTPSERLTGNTALQMIPQPQYRWFDMLSEGPLSVLDLNFYGVDYQGNLVQIQIEPGQAVNVKLLFDRKTKASEHLHCDDRIRAVDEATGSGLFKKRRITAF